MWFLIEVDNEKNIGKDETARLKVSTSAEICRNWTEDNIFDGTIEEIHHPATPSTDYAHTGDDKDIISKLYAAIHRVEDKHEDLKEAFESERDHYDECLKEIRLQLSQLQTAFIKYVISEKTVSRGAEQHFDDFGERRH